MAALGFATLPMPSYDRALHALRSWLDSWRGIGAVSVGMHRQGYDLQLTQYDERRWRATFLRDGDRALAHGRHRVRVGTNAMGAVQVSARGALMKADANR
jgi:hypothetical protein